MKILCLLPLVLTIPAICSAQNTFPASGNVGIGTTSPVSPLDVNGNVGISAGSHYFLDSGIGAVSLYKNTGDNSLRFQTNGAIDRLTITASGNVGIGTSTPANAFEVYGDNSRSIARASSAAGQVTVEAQAYDYWSTPTYTGTALRQYGVSATGSTSGLSNAGLGMMYFQNDSNGLIATNGAPLVFATSYNNESMRITPFGNVGIGTTTPDKLLTLFGGDLAIRRAPGQYGPNLLLDASNSGGSAWYITSDGTSDIGGVGNLAFLGGGASRLIITGTGNVGIGTVSPAATLDVNGGAIVRGLTGTNGGALSIFGAPSLEGGQINLMDAGATVATQTSQWSIDNFAANLRFFRGTSSPPQMTLTAAGNLGIGGDPGTYKLAVNGTIHTKEVVVDTNGWSDYVFKPGYRLAPLSEVQATIRQEGHLPGLPSAQEVAEHGVSVGEMQAKLLAKIEELTLHQIEQEKEISALKAANSDQSRQIQQLRAAAHMSQR